MRLLQRNHIITDEGYVHQSWTVVYPDKDTKLPSLKDIVMTLDVRHDKEVKTLYGMYKEEDYKRKISEVDYIQENLPNKSPDKNPHYIKRERNE